MTPESWLSTLLGAGAIFGGVGYAIGQFISSRRKGLGDSLATAMDEISVARQRGDRLSSLLAEKTDELSQARSESQMLRSAIVGGGVVSSEIVDAINNAVRETKAAVHAEHEKTREAIRKAVGHER